MPSQFMGLNIGASGLFAYQASINTTANNISNVKTEGYSRQETTLAATNPLRVYAKYGSTGTGVEATEIKQIRDIYYDTKYWQNNSSVGYFEQKIYYLNQVENVFADDGIQEGFSTIFAKMFNGLDTLHGDNASDESVRNQFIHQAQNLCTYFNSVSDALKELQKDTNEEISNTISNINAIAEKIALINKEINKLELNGGYANELRDKRAMLLDELSGIVNVSTDEYEIKNTYGENLGGTNFTVFVNGQLLVDGNDYRQLECISNEYKQHQTDATGLYSVRWADTKTDFAATTQTAGGTLKALFDLRDGNNNEAMKGTVKSVNQNDAGAYTSITMENVSNATVNALNIPPEGTVKVGNNFFVYKSWEANLDDEGNIVDITYHLAEPMDTLLAGTLDGDTIEVGKNVDSMGIPYYQAQINEFLRNFCELFNNIQKKGETLDGEPMGAFFIEETPTGNIYDFDGWGDVDADGNVLAEPKKISSTEEGYHQMLAFDVKVNDTSINDPRYFSTTVDITNGADAYDLVDEMMKLQDEVTMYRGDNAEAFLETLLSDIAVDTEKNTVFYKNYYNMSAVIETQRMSVSGVDEDEEALNLVKFQNAYNLSSKVISVMNEIYNKLINETGVT